jgi:hypothetical protein
VVECGGLENRQAVLPRTTNQQLTVHSTTWKWGVLGGFGTLLCNRMCNSQNFVPQHSRWFEPIDVTALRLGVRNMLRPYTSLPSQNF